MDKRYVSIKDELEALSEPEFARFTAGLLRKPQETGLSGLAAHVLGVRLPALRRLAKRLSKENWRENLNALSAQVLQAANAGDTSESTSFEEVLLWGFLVGNAKIEALEEMQCRISAKNAVQSAGQEKRQENRRRKAQEEIELAEQFELIRQFVPQIDNWAICDSFCASLKFAKEYPAETWEFILPYLRSDQEYEIRFGVVMIINYFITEEYIDLLFPVFDSIGHEGYYVKMAVAWAVSICYVRFPEKTQKYLEETCLDDFTYHKALQKIVESRCVSDEIRTKMRRMKRR